MNLKHTPTPWKLDAHLIGQIVSQDDTKLIARAGRVEPIADLDQCERVANAEFIVCACNSHDQLVTALRSVLAEIGDYGRPNVRRDALKVLAAAGAA